MPIGTSIYKIPESNIPKLQAKLAKLNQAALRIGMKPVTINTLGIQEIKDDKGFVHRIYEVHIDGEAPKLAGWTFVATLTHAPEGNIIRTTPNETVPKQYYTAPPCCDYCKKDWIQRRDTYIVKNEKGEYRQVGSNCLADFLGHPDPNSYAAVAEMMAYLDKDAEELEKEDTGPNSPAFDRADTEEYLTYVAATIDQEGWISGKQAYENPGTISTAERALIQMEQRHTLRPNERVTITQKHKDEAKATLDHIRKTLTSPTNEYQHNLKTFASSNAFTVREGKGFVASMIPFYRRDMEKAIAQQKQAVLTKDSLFVGNIGERLYDIHITVLGIHETEGAYGTTYIIRMLDEQGNVYTWFGVGAAASMFERGKTYTISGTVKNHNEYKGRKETVLSRVKIEG